MPGESKIAATQEVGIPPGEKLVISHKNIDRILTFTKLIRLYLDNFYEHRGLRNLLDNIPYAKLSCEILIQFQAMKSSCSTCS